MPVHGVSSYIKSGSGTYAEPSWRASDVVTDPRYALQTPFDIASCSKGFLGIVSDDFAPVRNTTPLPAGIHGRPRWPISCQITGNCNWWVLGQVKGRLTDILTRCRKVTIVIP